MVSAVAAAGDALELSLPAQHLHFFDPASGRRAN
jgi:sn-glycerol 3-phosphate transport system ATP-binding protein